MVSGWQVAHSCLALSVCEYSAYSDGGASGGIREKNGGVGCQKGRCGVSMWVGVPKGLCGGVQANG